MTGTNSILDVLQNWDANFPVLQEIVAFLDKESLPPVLRPGKMIRLARKKKPLEG